MKTILYVYDYRFMSWWKRLAGVFRFAREHDWYVQVAEISEVTGDLMKYADFWQANGCIIDGGIFPHRKVKTAIVQNFPIVWCIGHEDDLTGERDCVLHDSVATAETAVRELVKRDCASYGYVGSHLKSHWSDLRKRVFERELDRIGAKWSTFDPTEGRKFRNITDFYDKLEGWLAGLRRPCGVFASNDEIGVYVLRAAERLGMRVPDDLLVIGVDNDELFCESTHPTLASVDPLFAEAGYASAELLDRRFADPKAPHKLVTFSRTSVVLRESLRTSRSRDRVALRAAEFIRLNAAKGIGAADVVREMGVSRRSAEMRFRRSEGRTIHDEIEAVRFDLACDILRRGVVSLDSVYARVGYRSERSLRNLFYKKTGCAPSTWLRRFGL